MTELEKYEEKLNESLKGFISYLFAEFFQKKLIFDNFFACLAELDCLCSLSTASFDSNFTCTRPTIETNYGQPLLDLKGAVHPVLASLSKNTFESNDISLNPFQNGESKFMIVSGPNMGGKSTILRTSA